MGLPYSSQLPFAAWVKRSPFVVHALGCLELGL